jgi:hypothetical protein
MVRSLEDSLAHGTGSSGATWHAAAVDANTRSSGSS